MNLEENSCSPLEGTAGVLLQVKEHATGQPSQPIEKKEKKNLKLFPIFSNKLQQTPTLKPLKLIFETQSGACKIGSNDHCDHTASKSKFQVPQNLNHNVLTAPIADIVVRPSSQQPTTHGLRHSVNGGVQTLEGNREPAGKSQVLDWKPVLTKDSANNPSKFY